MKIVQNMNFKKKWNTLEINLIIFSFHEIFTPIFQIGQWTWPDNSTLRGGQTLWPDFLNLIHKLWGIFVPYLYALDFWNVEFDEVDFCRLHRQLKPNFLIQYFKNQVHINNGFILIFWPKTFRTFVKKQNYKLEAFAILL